MTSGAISGVVRDSTGRPLASTEIRVISLDLVATSDDEGRYVLRAVPVGEHRLIARRVGYRPQAADVVLSGGPMPEVDFELERVTQELPTVEVRDRLLVPQKYQFTTRFDDFFRHRATAPSGRFFDRAELERYGGPARALATIPGIKAAENMGNLSVTFARCSPTTQPALLLNGVLTSFNALTTIPVSSIELVEVYRSVSEMPVEARGNACGALAIYTR